MSINTPLYFGELIVQQPNRPIPSKLAKAAPSYYQQQAEKPDSVIFIDTLERLGYDVVLTVTDQGRVKTTTTDTLSLVDRATQMPIFQKTLSVPTLKDITSVVSKQDGFTVIGLPIIRMLSHLGFARREIQSIQQDRRRGFFFEFVQEVLSLPVVVNKLPGLKKDI